MKILHICTYQTGGAAIAAIRLHKALISQGHDSKFLFLDCQESDTFFKIDKGGFLGLMLWKLVTKLNIPLSVNDLRIRKHQPKFEMFDFATSRYKNLHEHPLIQEADVVNLHWVAQLVDYKTFFAHIKKPLVWTLHDMNPIQGGFHYKEDEVRNALDLGDLDREQFEIKRVAMSGLSPDQVTVVAPSRWLTNLSSRSEILGKFSHFHIPYSLDRSIFKVRDKAASRAALQIGSDQIMVLFVSETLKNHRKGFDMIAELIRDKAVTDKCIFAAVGRVKGADQIPGIIYLGSVSSEEQMSLIYNAADLFIIPSREDNLPNTILESLCSGTPVVGFSIGGLKESIRDYQNGMLANGISVSELKDALLSAISYIGKFDRLRISTEAQQMYSAEQQVTRYLKIYNKDKAAAVAEA